MAGMRALTHAQIALINTNQPGFPESAASDETFVHVSGTMQAVLAGMHEITMRLRENKASSVPIRGGRRQLEAPAQHAIAAYPANPTIAPPLRQLQQPQQIIMQQQPMMQSIPQQIMVPQQQLGVSPQTLGVSAPLQPQTIIMQQPQLQQDMYQLLQPVQQPLQQIPQQTIQTIQQPQTVQVQQQALQMQPTGQQVQQIPQQAPNGSYGVVTQQNTYANVPVQQTSYGVPQQQSVEQEPVNQQQPQQLTGIKTSQFCVPIEKAGNIIGREGSKVNQIRAVTGAQIKIHDAAPGGRERIIEFTGTDEQVHSAHLMAYSFMIEDQNVPQTNNVVKQETFSQQPATMSAPQPAQSMQPTPSAGSNGPSYGYGNNVSSHMTNGGNTQSRQVSYPPQQYGNQANGQTGQFSQHQTPPTQGSYQSQYGQQSQNQNNQYRQQT